MILSNFSYACLPSLYIFGKVSVHIFCLFFNSFVHVFILCSLYILSKTFFIPNCLLHIFSSSLWLVSGFPGKSAGRESTCNVGELDSVPELGRCPGEGNCYPLQYYGLDNSMNSIVYGVAKCWI